MLPRVMPMMGTPALLDFLPPFDEDINAFAWFDFCHFGLSFLVLLVAIVTGKSQCSLFNEARL
jgi:hypothetical protein